jgi:hypothetical protein
MSHASLPKSRAIIEVILQMNANVPEALIAQRQSGWPLPAPAGPYSAYTEDLVDTFCNWYLRHLQSSDGNYTDIPS